MTLPLAHQVLAPLAGIAIAVFPALVDVPAPQDALTQDGAANPAEQREALAYWTEERMAAAQPLGVPSAGIAPDGMPTSATREQAAPVPESTGKPWTGGGKVVKTTGRVFLTMDGRDYTCSASVVRADNKDTVITAGHCIKDGAWAEKWTFVPAYDEGAHPYGRFAARELLVPPQWAEHTDSSYDFGMAVLAANSDGAHVAEETGAQEIAFGHGEGEQVYSFGYPTSGRYNGEELYYCSGRTFADDGGTTSSGMRCTMTQGSSGGPWLTGFDPATGTGTVTSVVSFAYTGESGLQYGPYLGEQAEQLYQKAQSL